MSGVCLALIKKYIVRFIIVIRYLQSLPNEILINRHKKSLPEELRKKTSGLERYLAVCKLAAEYDAIFKVFKRSNDYRVILEHVSKKHGKQYLTVIKENDLRGSPITYRYDVGRFSPTTLRYIKVLVDLKNIFGDLKNFHIVEIGAGYGGQCKIISDVFNVSSYTIIDLEPVLPLIQKYLMKLNVKNVIYLTQPKAGDAEKYDLVISNYAFSECLKSAQDDYMHSILYRAKRGYITYNYDGKPDSASPYNKEEIIGLLSKRHAIRIVDERPKTGSDNFIIIWDDIS